MSAEANKAIRKRILDEFEVGANAAVADELCAPEFVMYGMGEPIRGPEGVKSMNVMFHSAFPDLRGTIHDMVAEGDRVVSRWTFEGTHAGELMGISATGKRVTMQGIDVSRFADGKIVEMRINWDQLGLLQQLGVIPASAPTA